MMRPAELAYLSMAAHGLGLAENQLVSLAPRLISRPVPKADDLTCNFEPYEAGSHLASGL